MVYLKVKHEGCHYICEKVKENGRWKEKYWAPLGRCTREDAEAELERWKFTATKKYRCVVIDPPWPMKKSLRTVRPNQVDMDYELMTVRKIREFPLHKFISPDGCHVYLWTTHKHQRDAFEVFDAWGVDFHYAHMGQRCWIYTVQFYVFY